MLDTRIVSIYYLQLDAGFKLDLFGSLVIRGYGHFNFISL